MENEININKENINSLLSSLTSDKNGDTKAIEQAVKEALSPEQQDKINSVLSDPERLKKILSSPKIKILLNMIKDKKE